MVNQKRVRLLKEGVNATGPVVYWMSRDQRVNDNWALLYAQELALEYKSPLLVIFCLVPHFLGATMRHYGFMLNGLHEVEETLAVKKIPFRLLTGCPEDEIPGFIKRYKISVLITDFDPLRIKREWKRNVGAKISIPFYEVDAHNIVPCWIASSKQEYAAYTFRPKVSRLLPGFLEEFPRLKKHPFQGNGKGKRTDWQGALSSLKVDSTVSEVSRVSPGEKAARRVLRSFINKKLSQYDFERNNPVADGQSDLSAYLHFGQFSAQRVAWDIQKSGATSRSIEAFLEELIVRRELSDNFCYYNRQYDSFESFPEWAQKTLVKHRKDRRKYVYAREEFENAQTHDNLWNAAQLEMVKRGKMHGYMRMYWAKKILEWTASAEEAIEMAIYLNDRYELDGRDPNGYTGIAWSIGGVHDRAWPERPVFGKVRYMSYNGCKSKFDVDKYIEKVAKM